VALRQAGRADLPEIVDIWVDAFDEDPFHRWVQPDADAWPVYVHAWMTFVAELVLSAGHTFMTPDAAVAWVPPDVALIGPDDFARGRAIVAEHAGERRAEHAVATILGARAHDPDESHWTLQYLGVRQRAQARGVGATAVAPGLERCDAAGLPCALVSTNARNVPFYERHGFDVVAEVFTPDDDVALRPMHRPPARR
jgi:GNAT superfamily N-acetyltransferase